MLNALVNSDALIMNAEPHALREEGQRDGFHVSAPSFLVRELEKLWCGLAQGQGMGGGVMGGWRAEGEERKIEECEPALWGSG